MRSLLVVLPLLLLGCTEARTLDREPMPLTPSERADVESSVQRAEAAKAWTSAWNQAVDGGLDRSTLERIVLGALADGETGEAASMLEALRDKYLGEGQPGLTPDARAKVTALSDAAALEDRWARAVEIEIAAADARAGDGTFPGAWRIYRKAPPGEAPALLELIDEARKEARENRDGD